MSPYNSLSRWLFLLAVLVPAVGCGSGGKAKPQPPVAANTEPPATVPPQTPPATSPLPPITIPEIPPPVEAHRPMPLPDPLPPDEPTAGPAVKLPETLPMPTPVPSPVPPPVPVAVPNTPMPPVAPEPIPGPLADPNKKPEYPEFISGRDLKEWLKEATTHKDPQYREAALKVLPLFGPDARKPIIRPLCDIIRNRGTDPSIRVTAIAIVSNLGFDFRVDNDKATPDERRKMAELRTESREVIGALMAVMADTLPGSTLRQYCAQSLATFGSDAHKAVGTPTNTTGTLRALAFDPSWATRHAVAQTLGVVGQPAEKDGKPDRDGNPYDPATDILLNVLLKDNCAAVRVAAAQSLLRLGPPRAKDTAELAKALDKYLKPVNARVEPGPGGRVLEEDADVLVWVWLLQLSYDGTKLDGNVRKIASQVKEPKTPGVRLQGLFALSALGPAAAPAMPAVREVLERYDDPIVLIAAMEVCAAMGTKGGADALPELQAIRDGKHAPRKPDNAPRDWQPDPTLRYAAEDCIAVVTGKRKLMEVKKDPAKEKDAPEKK